MSTIWRDKVVINGVTFNDNTALPTIASGIVTQWGLDVMLGWHDTPEPEAEFAPKGLVDGEVPAEFFPIRGRQLTLGGFVESTTRAGAEELLDVLARDAFPRNTRLELARYETVPKTVSGWRNGPFQPLWNGGSDRQFRWGVLFRADDPFRYALNSVSGTSGVAGQAEGGRVYPRTYPLEYTTTSSGEANSVVLNILGTADTPKFVATLDGPLTSGGWRISNDTTGDLIKVHIGLLEDDQLVIDFASELVYLNGVVLNATITGDFFRLKPGVNVLKLYADFDPDAQMTVEAYSAWE